MRKVALSLLPLVLFLSLASCQCTAEKGAVSRLQDQQEKIFTKYAVYVAADAKLDAKAKDDELKLIQSLRDVTTSLRKSLGD
jgi:hypothetical protein